MPVSGWDVVDGHHLHRVFRFPDFAQALAFVNRIGAAAEEQNHHPDLLLTWGRVEVSIFTHTINGISGKDHALATMIDSLYTVTQQQ